MAHSQVACRVACPLTWSGVVRCWKDMARSKAKVCVVRVGSAVQ